MLGSCLSAKVQDPEEEALVARGRRLSYGSLRAAVRKLRPLLRAAGGDVAVSADDPFLFTAAAAAADAEGLRSFLVGPVGGRGLAALEARLRWSLLLDDAAILGLLGEGGGDRALPDATEGSVVLFTSGTAGEPKAITHTWRSLAAGSRRASGLEGSRWLATYPLHLFAGTQVLLQVLLSRATLVVPPSSRPDEVSRCLEEEGVTHASGTPTFWRQLLAFGTGSCFEKNRLAQITLGGEVADQQLLDELRSRFPKARIVHIYASTELGRLFSVSDAREGFPAAWLQSCPEAGTELRIRDGVLEARSARRMSGYFREGVDRPGSDWHRTGDRVVIEGDRARFLGRESETINVGGAKVDPARVEAALRCVEGVADLRVVARKSSLAGSLVALEVVLRPGADAASVRRGLVEMAKVRLGREERPRQIEFVERLAISSALKLLHAEDS